MPQADRKTDSDDTDGGNIPFDAKTTEEMHSTNPRLISARKRAIDIATARHIDGKIYPQQTLTLTQRLQQRLQQEQRDRQANLESIMRIGASLCQDTLAVETDPDWISSFLQLAQETRGSAMQRLWGRILAQEIVQPGSFSIKALRTLRDMTQREARLFQRACAVSCSFSSDSASKRIITGLRPAKSGLKALFRAVLPEQLNLGTFKLPYSALLLLQELGLLLGGELESGSLIAGKPFYLHFSGSDLSLTAAEAGHRLTYYRFSPVGEELSQLLTGNVLPEYVQLLSTLFGAHVAVSVRQTTVTASAGVL